jgi:hypothetical protein
MTKSKDQAKNKKTQQRIQQLEHRHHLETGDEPMSRQRLSSFCFKY